jgi:hypothetical protein
VERVYLWNAFIRVTRLSLWNAFICGTYFFVECTTLVFVERPIFETSLFVECCYKETTATQEVENIDKVDKEKVEEESKLALVEVQVVDDTEDVEEEPAKVPPQQAKPREIAATKKSLRMQDKNVLARANKKAKLEAHKIAGNRKK